MKVFFIFSVVLMTLSGSIGAVLFKKAMDSLQGKSIWHVIRSFYFYVGGACYALGLLTNIILLNYFDYTVVYPCTSLTYVWTLLTSVMILKEKINWQKIVSVGLILFGVIMICL